MHCVLLSRHSLFTVSLSLSLINYYFAFCSTKFQFSNKRPKQTMVLNLVRIMCANSFETAFPAQRNYAIYIAYTHNIHILCIYVCLICILYTVYTVYAFINLTRKCSNKLQVQQYTEIAQNHNRAKTFGDYCANTQMYVTYTYVFMYKRAFLIPKMHSLPRRNAGHFVYTHSVFWEMFLLYAIQRRYFVCVVICCRTARICRFKYWRSRKSFVHKHLQQNVFRTKPHL